VVAKKSKNSSTKVWYGRKPDHHKKRPFKKREIELATVEKLLPRRGTGIQTAESNDVGECVRRF